jgi:hypothetical protein
LLRHSAFNRVSGKAFGPVTLLSDAVPVFRIFVLIYHDIWIYDFNISAAVGNEA